MSNIKDKAVQGFKSAAIGAVGSLALSGCVSTPQIAPVQLGDHWATFTCYQGDVMVGLYDRDLDRIDGKTLPGGRDFQAAFDGFVSKAIKSSSLEGLVQSFKVDSSSQITNTTNLPSYATICSGYSR